jgi:hypothetical protein
MKQFFRAVFFPVCLFMGALNAQVCTPDPGVTSGISPTSSNVACANKGQAFSQVFTFAIPLQLAGLLL